MIVRDYLGQYALISNTYDIFNYDTLKARFIVRYGNQKIRRDMPISDIATTAQNTIDINRDYFSALFSSVINPYETWSETDTHNDSGTEDKTRKNISENITAHTGTVTNANTGTVTNANTGTVTNNATNNNTTTGTTHSDNPTTSTVTNSVNAYNSDTAVPRDNSSTTNTNVSDSNYTETANGTNINTETLNTTNTQTLDTTATETLNNTDTTNTTNSGTETTTRDNSGGYKKQGYNVNDYIAATRAYYTAYDIVIDYIARDILITVPEWGC